MADVKAAEVSAIIKQQLTGFDTGVSLDEVGSTPSRRRNCSGVWLVQCTIWRVGFF